MKSPEKGFRINTAAAEALPWDTFQGMRRQWHYEEQIHSKKKEEFQNLEDWQIGTYEDIGVRFCARFGEVEVVNLEGFLTKIIVCFFRVYPVEPGASVSEKAKNKLVEITHFFINSKLQEQSGIESSKNRASELVVVSAPKWMNQELNVQLGIKEMTPEENRKNGLKILVENGFSAYQEEGNDALKDVTKEQFCHLGEWQEERDEKLGFLIKKRVGERAQEEGKIIHIFMHIYPLSDKKELSNKALKRIAQMQHDFIVETVLSHPEAIIVPLETPPWMLKD